MAIDYRTAYCQVCERETKQWKPSHRSLWSCDSCNTSNLDENGRYNCLNSLHECVRCETFLSCLGKLNEDLLEKVIHFCQAREALERQEIYILAPSDEGAGAGEGANVGGVGLEWRRKEGKGRPGKEEEERPGNERERRPGKEGKEGPGNEGERSPGKEGKERTEKEEDGIQGDSKGRGREYPGADAKDSTVEPEEMV